MFKEWRTSTGKVKKAGLVVNVIVYVKCRRQNCLPLITNFPKSLQTHPNGSVTWLVTLADFSQNLTGPSAYTLHSNPIPPTNGTNGFL